MGDEAKPDILQTTTPDPTTVMLPALENWRSVVTLLEEYLDTQIHVQHSITGGWEKAKKVVATPPKFADSDESKVGISEAFKNLREKTDVLLNKSSETEESLKSSVLPQLATLKGDIEKHIKGLKGTNLKGLKEIEKAQANTKKHVETLGQYASSFANSQKLDVKNDPYLLHRTTRYAIEDQLQKENVQRDAVLSSQKNYKTLQVHIVQVIKQATSLMEQVQTDYAASHTESFKSIAKTFGHIEDDHEWNQFVKQNPEVLVTEDSVKRSVNDVSFSNDQHESTVPLMEGSLERKSGKLMKSYSTGYFVLTPAKYLHYFKSSNLVSDPSPESSIYLPECTLGPMSAADSGKHKFTITGKTQGKSVSLGQKHTYSFKAASRAELEKWYEKLQDVSGTSVHSGGAVADSSRKSSSSSTPATSPTSATAAAGTTAAVGAGAAGAGTAAAAGNTTAASEEATSPVETAKESLSSPTDSAPTAETTASPTTEGVTETGNASETATSAAAAATSPDAAAATSGGPPVPPGSVDTSGATAAATTATESATEQAGNAASSASDTAAAAAAKAQDAAQAEIPK